VLAGASSFFSGAPDWLSSQVLICATAAVGLFVLSLLLRGIQKVVTLVLVVVLLVGAFWFLRDAWRNKEKFLSPALSAQLDSLADKTLRSPQAIAAWEAAKKKFAEMARSVRPATDEARQNAIAEELTTRAAALRRDGHKTAADELLRMREQMKRERSPSNAQR
jgi:hypothetical protein